MNKFYIVFLKGSLPALTNLNFLHQVLDPINRIMHDASRKTDSILIGRLFTQCVVKTFNSKGLRWEIFLIFYIRRIRFTLIKRLLCAFLVLYGRIISKTYLGHCLSYNLKMKHSFLYQCLCWRDSKPSSWYIFSIDVPLMALATAKAALYCRDSIFWWKELLKAWL